MTQSPQNRPSILQNWLHACFGTPKKFFVTVAALFVIFTLFFPSLAGLFVIHAFNALAVAFGPIIPVLLLILIVGGAMYTMIFGLPHGKGKEKGKGKK